MQGPSLLATGSPTGISRCPVTWTPLHHRLSSSPRELLVPTASWQLRDYYASSKRSRPDLRLSPSLTKTLKGFRPPCSTAGADGFDTSAWGSAYHPAEACLRMEGPPTDMSPAAFSLAMEELTQLYDTSLVAPRAFRHVTMSRRRHRQAQHSPGTGEADADSTDGTLSGFITDADHQSHFKPPSSRQLLMHGALRAFWSSAAAPRPLSSDVVASCPGAASRKQQPPLTSSQQLEAGHSGLGAPLQTSAAVPPSRSGDGETGGGSIGGNVLLRGAEGIDRTGEDSGCWNGDPRRLPRYPTSRLGRLLGECSTAGAPLRLSSLQAYLDAVSHRALELTAEDLVAALEGLARYSFRTNGEGPGGRALLRTGPGHLRPSPMPRVSSGSSTESSTAVSTIRTSSGSNWAEPILSALVTPYNGGSGGAGGAAAARTNVPPVELPTEFAVSYDSAAGACAAVPSRLPSSRISMAEGEAGDSGGVSDGGVCGGGGSSRHVAVAATQRLGRIAFLSNGRVVQLLQLLVELEVQPSPGWMAAFLDCTASQVKALTGGELLQLLSGLMTLGSMAPSRRWWSAVLDAWNPMAATKTSAVAVAAPTSAAATVRQAGDVADDISCTAQEVRCAVLYHAVRLTMTADGDGDDGKDGDSGGNGRTGSSSSSFAKPPGHARAATVIPRPRLALWARDALFDIARVLLPYVSRQVEVGASSDDSSERDDNDGGGGGGGGNGEEDPSLPLPMPLLPVSPAALAMALVALPEAVPDALTRVSDPTSRGGAVLSVLVCALQPHLRDVPPHLLMELLQGFISSGLHPGPVFLKRHATALKLHVRQLSPREVLQVAGLYRRLGVLLKGGLRAALRWSRERLRLERERERQRQRTAAARVRGSAGPGPDGRQQQQRRRGAARGRR